MTYFTKINKIVTSAEIVKLYDPIFCFFSIYGIDISGKERVNIWGRIARIIYYMLSAVTFIILVFVHGKLLNGINQDSVSPIFFFYTGIIINFTLNRKRKIIAEHLKKLSDFELSNSFHSEIRLFRKKLYFWSTSAILLLLVTTVSAFATYNRKAETSPFITLMEFFHEKAYFIFDILWTITSIISCHIPSLLFLFLQGTVAWHLKCILRQVKHAIEESPLDFKRNQLIYTSASNLVWSTDKIFSEMAMLSLLQKAMTLYMMVYGILEYGFMVTPFVILGTLSCLLNFMVLGFAMSFVAEISDINEEILKVAHNIPMYDGSQCERLSFILQIQNGVSLTVNGVTPIKKGTFWTLTGSVLTYTLLIKSLPQ